MGQQQLLLIVLGVIIVGIAIAVGINMFVSNAANANRDAVISDLNNLAAQAQQYWRKPTEMGGGNQSFNGLKYNARDTANANGHYYWGTSPSGTNELTTAVSGVTTTLYLIGVGKEKGHDNTNPVKVVAIVTSETLRDSVAN